MLLFWIGSFMCLEASQKFGCPTVDGRNMKQPFLSGTTPSPPKFNVNVPWSALAPLDERNQTPNITFVNKRAETLRFRGAGFQHSACCRVWTFCPSTVSLTGEVNHCCLLVELHFFPGFCHQNPDIAVDFSRNFHLALLAAAVEAAWTTPRANGSPRARRCRPGSSSRRTPRVTQRHRRATWCPTRRG